ncbi:hypothetical protein, variant [Verruconis gallopava]|nr:hypothetical protein, variant [Verruconis gallopava]KIW04759.1 hypothetical protein, variant [Verruconis gallopava]
MIDGKAPCARCRKRGLSCTVNKSLQMLLEDDASWKHSVTRKLHVLEQFMDTVRDKLQLPEAALSSEQEVEFSNDISAPACIASHSTNTPPASSSLISPQIRTWEVRMDIDTGPAAIPASIVSEVRTDITPTIPALNADFVTQGVVTLEQAESLFATYRDRLDHYLYRILGESISLRRVRGDSPLCMAAICTVSALHSKTLGHLFHKCYHKFQELCAAQVVAKDANLNDIRGLCIGAFWLADLSWALVGLAVRIATQMQLHRCLNKALRGDKLAYLQTRLYYLVYVCDHHFSIAYGRSPMSRDCEMIRSAKSFMRCPHAGEDDFRLISQVEIWSTGSRVLDTFDFDMDAAITPEQIPKIRRFGIALDTWRADWNERFRPNDHVGNYPAKGVGMHFHFAKLYLCSHAFRGVPIKTGMATPYIPSLHPELEEVASAAVVAAKSILRTLIEDKEMQIHLNGLPLYFDTMIAFAVVFLLKVATQYAKPARVDSTELLHLVEDMTLVLKNIAEGVHRNHILVVIAEGLASLLQRVKDAARAPAADGMALEPANHHQPPASTPNSEQFINSDFDWMTFDLLGPQDSGVEPAWPLSYDFTNH